MERIDYSTVIEFPHMEPGALVILYPFMEDEKMTRTEIFEKARVCVYPEKETDYCSSEDNFKMIADLWGYYLGHEYTMLDVVIMIFLKVARIRGDGSDNSFVDLASYATCGAEIFGRQNNVA